MRRKTARKIQPHLAALRRHARALTGGDSDLVQRTMHSAREEQYRALPARDVRTRLFRDFHDIYGRSEAAAGDQPADLDRYGLMLRHAQGFSIQEVSDILRGDVLDMQRRLEQAYGELHRRPGVDLLLVQDDAVLAKVMTDAIESMGHRVLGVAANLNEALATAQAIKVDAVVMDVSGSFDDGDQSSPMERLLGRLEAPIIVVASGGVEPSERDPAYLVTTPFQPSELKVMLDQALHNRA